MENDNAEGIETQEILDTVLADVAVETPEIQVPAKTREPVQAVQSAGTKDRAAERRADREAGRNSVLEALNKRAQAAGFDTVDEMLKAGPQGKPVAKPVDKGAADAALVSENTSLKRTIQGLRSRISTLENDLALRQMAYESEVNGDDIDYALSAMQKHYSKLPAEEAKAFDPQKYLGTDLRAKKPGIFRQVLQSVEQKKIEEQDVSTSPLSGRPPTATSASEVQKAGAEQPKKATAMSKQEFSEHLRQRGFRDPASMV